MTMMMPVTAAMLAAFLILFQQFLMMAVGMYRFKVRRGVGHGDDQVLERITRRHGNLVENAAIFVVTVALLEGLTGQTPTVAWLCGVFAGARVLHALGFSTLGGSHTPDFSAGNLPFIAMRSFGAMGTALSGIAAGGFLAATLIARSAV